MGLIEGEILGIIELDILSLEEEVIFQFYYRTLGLKELNLIVKQIPKHCNLVVTVT